MEEFNPEFNTLKLHVFSNKMAAAFKCEKCTEVSIPTQPYSCDKGHIFCKQCLEQSVENKEKCPNGNHEITVSNENIGIKNIIQNLQIVCPMNDEFEDKKEENVSDIFEKCEWKGTAGDVFAHLPQCPLYIEFNKVLESDVKLNRFEQIISKMGSEMNDLSNAVKTVQQELRTVIMSSKNQNPTDSKEQQNDELINIAETHFLGTCSKCNKNVENSVNNIKLVSNKWEHVNCDYKPVKLAVTETDVWCDAFRAALLYIDKQIVTLDPKATCSYFQTVFGLITVDTGSGIKEWKIRINKLKNTNLYIGVINTLKLAQSLSNNAYKNGISMNGNGHIYRFDKDSYPCGYQFKEGDIVSVILDVNNRLLVFKINHFVIPVTVNDLNIDLQNMKWRLFASLRNPGDQIILLDSDKEYEPGNTADDEKVNISTYNCNKCNSSISKRDFETNNIHWSSEHEWQHSDCSFSKYTLPDLSDVSQSDEFNPILAFKNGIVLSNNGTTFASTKSNVYQTVYGIMTVSAEQKVWSVRIESGTSNMYVGIIESDKIPNVATNSIPNSGAYYLGWNGQIGGSGVSKQTQLAYTTGDVINIILNMKQHTLGFGINSDKYVLVNAVNLNNKSFNMFCTLYAVNNTISIGGVAKDSNQKPDISQAIDVCQQCNNKIFSTDFDLRNVIWNETSNKWSHINCNLDVKVPELELSDTDMWHPLLSNPQIQLYEKYTSIGGHSSYWNMFGVISVNEGLKKWDIKINVQPSYTYIGIINSNAMKNKKTGIPSNDGYYLNYSGYIQGRSLSIPMNCTLKVNDIVTIILDKNKGTLCFGINYNNFKYAKGAVLNGSYNLFCTSYYANTSFTILGEAEGKEDEKEEEQLIGKCTKCNRDVFDGDLKSKNLTWNDTQNQWCHTDCNMKKKIVPKLTMTDVDQWHPKLTNAGINITDGYSFIGGYSSYWNAFGVISVNKGVKVWTIRINQQPTYLYIGIIDSNAMKRKQIGIPSNEGYYLAFNGHIQGRGLSIPIGYTFKVKDRIKIILDLTKYTLCFGINDKTFVYAKGAMLKHTSFNLFCTSYYQNSSVTILGEQKSDSIGDHKGKMLYTCGSCSKPIFEMDFEINNVKNNNSNTWFHIECNFNIPKLSVNSRDQWNRMISNRNITIQSYDAYTSGGGYHNAFGIISITKNTKRWNVKFVAGGTSHLYIGIIDSSNLYGRQTGIPSNDGYYWVSHNGYIQGSGLSIKAGPALKVGDIVNVILDMDKGVLSFGRNNADYAHAKGANIKGRSFNLFCNMYYANQKVTIQS